MKRPTMLMLLAALGRLDDAPLVIDVRTPKAPHPADTLPKPFRDNEKIRAAEAKRERRRKRGW